MATHPRAVVVGGGVSGIATALCLAETGWEVSLLEEAPILCPAWRSRRIGGGEQGGDYDLGVRVPAESGVGWADALVFHALPPGPDGKLAWNRMPGFARQGHVVAGRANLYTSCLDARHLPPAIVEAALAELLARAATPDPGARAPCYAARAHAIYGPTLLREAIDPACRSLLGAPAEALAWNAPQGRLPPRLVLADHATTDALQLRGRLGERLAHPSARTLAVPATARAYLYPRQGGIGAWLAGLERQLAAKQVAVRARARIAAILATGMAVQGVALEGGETLAADLVVWTIRPDALPLPGLQKIPAATCPVGARLLLLDRAAPHDLHWAVSYDPATPFMRAGFPDALADTPRGDRSAVLLETRIGPDGPASDAALLDSLRALGLVHGQARLLAAETLGEGRFAVETTQAATARAAVLDAVHGLRGLAVLGSAGGGHVLVPDLVAEAATLAADAAARHAPLSGLALPAPAFA